MPSASHTYPYLTVHWCRQRRTRIGKHTVMNQPGFAIWLRNYPTPRHLETPGPGILPSSHRQTITRGTQGLRAGGRDLSLFAVTCVERSRQVSPTVLIPQFSLIPHASRTPSHSSRQDLCAGHYSDGARGPPNCSLWPVTSPAYSPPPYPRVLSHCRSAPPMNASMS